MKAILKLGVRELDLVTSYTGHMYDPVLGVYYARARMYDAADRRFMAVDPIKGIIIRPATLSQYSFVVNNPLKYVDLTGLSLETVTRHLNGLGVISPPNSTRNTSGSVSTSIPQKDSARIDSNSSMQEQVRTEWQLTDSLARSLPTHMVSPTTDVISPSNNNASGYDNSLVCGEGQLYVALGSTFDLGRGWEGRIERHGSGRGMQRHVHIINGNREWSQNEDGSPHDGGKNSPGSPPKRVLDKLKGEKGWDWVIKEMNWLTKIEKSYDPAGYVDITYPNGRKVVVYKNPGFPSFQQYTLTTQELRDYSLGPTFIDLSGSTTSTHLAPHYVPILPTLPVNPAPMPLPAPWLPLVPVVL